MYRNKRFIGIIILLITIFTWISPTAKVFAENTSVIKVDSKLQGVTYKLNPEVVEMPSGINYEVLEEEIIEYDKLEEPIPEEEIIKNSIKRKVSIPTKTNAIKDKRGLKLKGKSKLPTNISTEEPLWNREKSYIPKSITVDNQTLKKINPKVGKVYFDPINHTTIKVIGEAKADGSGGMSIPVEKPDLSEIIEDVNIPEQTITLSEEDIVYINPEVEIVDTSSASRGQVAAKDGFVPSDRGAWIKIKLDGLPLIKEGTDVQNERDDEERERKLKEEKDKLIKESGYWNTLAQREQLDADAKAEQAAIDKEREGEMKVSADVKIKKGYIKIFEPEISASLDWDWGILSAEARADIDIESDIIIEGKVRLQKEVEILIQGFEVDFKIGKIACGVYLVVGIDGRIRFETRVQQQGTATVGVATKGFLVPMVVYPFVDYDNTALETQMMLTGELKLWALAMPKVTLQILDVPVLDARFRIGIEAGASFSIGGEEADTFRLWIDILLQLKVQAIFFEGGFEERWNLYDKTKVYDPSQPIGGGSDGVSKARGHVLIEIERMDAKRDIIVGSVTRCQSPTSKPESVQGEKVKIKILQVDGKEIVHEATLDEKGKFYSNVPITPLDRVIVSYDKEDLEYDYNTTSPHMNIRPPYIVNSIFRDGFNNKVIGKVVGEIYGPNGIASDGDEETFGDKIYVRISKDEKSGGKGYYVPVDENGKFSLDNVALSNEDLISAGLVFEGAQVETNRGKPELGLEIYHTLIESEDKKSFRVEGAIQNLYGDKLYKGSVKFYNGKGELLAESKAHELNEITTIKETPKPNRPNESTIKPNIPDGFNYNISKNISSQKSIIEKMKDAMYGREMEIRDPSTIFELNIPVPISIIFAVGGGGYIVIEHNGIKKYINVIGKAKEPEVPVLERAVVSPVEEIINSRINPVMGRDMKKTIVDNAIKLQDPSAKINLNQTHGVLYSLVSTPASQSSTYSFKEGNLILSAKGEKNSIELSWVTTLDTTNIDGYRIYRGISSGGEELVPITGTIAIKVNKYVDTKVTPGTTFYYLCSVVYKNGDEFIISNEVIMTK